MGTGMYDEKRVPYFKMPAYPHEELNAGGRGRALDPVKYLQAAEQRARERQVAYETVRILRQDVIQCYRKEGVNHYENCREVVERYGRLVAKRDAGQVQPEWADEAKKEGW